MKIKVSNNFGHLGLTTPQFETDGHVLRCDWPADQIEGMICWWEFTEEFLAFRGPKVFYCCEPSFYFDGIRSPKRLLRRRLASLRQDEFCWHYHPDATMRVVHHTDWYPGIPRLGDEPRKRQAVAVVGNLGRPLVRNAGRQARLNFILGSGCDILGREAQWRHFRLHLLSRSGPPSTYQGECQDKVDSISKYHANICLENSSEPLYFTEKFLHAVQAGCVPIYHAHPSVREAFLGGAIWVDPADYAWNPRATMDAALNMDRKHVAAVNHRWRESHPRVLQTDTPTVYSRIAGILALKSKGEIDLPERASRGRLKDEYQ